MICRHTIMKKKAAFIVLLVLTAAAASTTTASPPGRSPTRRWSRSATTTGDIVESVQVTGTLQPVRTVNVGSQVSGVVDGALDADFNSVVRKGSGHRAPRSRPSFRCRSTCRRRPSTDSWARSRTRRCSSRARRSRSSAREALFAKGLVTEQALDEAKLQVGRAHDTGRRGEEGAQDRAGQPGPGEAEPRATRPSDRRSTASSSTGRWMSGRPCSRA